jgi:hypothetical protein
MSRKTAAMKSSGDASDSDVRRIRSKTKSTTKTIVAFRDALQRMDVGDVLLPPTCLLSRAASVFKSIAPLMLARMLPDPIREAVIRFTYATGHGHVCVERGVFET